MDEIMPKEASGGAPQTSSHHPRFWKFYRTAKGTSPVNEFLDKLSDDDAAAVLAEMEYVAEYGEQVARKLRGEIYEVRVSGKDVIYRILFATEGRWSQVLLALHAYTKKWQEARQEDIDRADKRLADWRQRGQAFRLSRKRPKTAKV